MSATAAALTSGPVPESGADRRPGIGRLTAVELRKMTDTRSGFWLPIAIGTISLIVIIVSSLVHGGHDASWQHLLNNGLAPDGFLLPVLGILLVCGEFTQRTTLTTFTLVPNRGRVLVAKMLASIIFVIGAYVVTVVMSAVFAFGIGNHPGGAGGLSGIVILQSLFDLAASMLIGIGFGAAILVSAPGIVAYLLLPTIWGALASSINALATLDHWLDIGTTMQYLPQHAISAIGWAHVGTTLALWMLLPLTIGWYRFRTKDIE
jgi:ABC-2 type transport system permease protein